MRKEDLKNETVTEHFEGKRDGWRQQVTCQMNLSGWIRVGKKKNDRVKS